MIFHEVATVDMVNTFGLRLLVGRIVPLGGQRRRGEATSASKTSKTPVRHSFSITVASANIFLLMKKEGAGRGRCCSDY